MSWRTHAGELADWTLANWARRRDCYGGYWETEFGEIQMTTCHRWLYTGVLAVHYSGIGCPVGLHDCDEQGRGNRITVDVDAHSSEADPAKNWELTQRLLDVCRSVGLEPIVEDSNGAGGYHLRIWLAGDRPTGELLSAGRWLVDRAGLPAETEVFPKQERPSKYGSWVRLPGRHHKRDHWSRFWVGGAWIGEGEACRYLLSQQPQAGDLPGEAWGYRRAEQIRREEERATKEKVKAITSRYIQFGENKIKPWDEFAEITTWDEILEPHGWRCVRSGDVCYWARPGVSHASATTGKVGDCLYVFSSGAKPFESSKPYSKFAAWTLLNFNGDFKVSVREFKARKEQRRNGE